jgi:mycofactocin precursor
VTSGKDFLSPMRPPRLFRRSLISYHGGMATPETAPTTLVAPQDPPVDDRDLVEEDLLVEEISIDGMCGVY